MSSITTRSVAGTSPSATSKSSPKKQAAKTGPKYPPATPTRVQPQRKKSPPTSPNKPGPKSASDKKSAPQSPAKKTGAPQFPAKTKLAPKPKKKLAPKAKKKNSEGLGGREGRRTRTRQTLKTFLQRNR
jgi:hypothetical protein